jgi:hypothetical protein
MIGERPQSLDMQIPLDGRGVSFVQCSDDFDIVYMKEKTCLA